MTGIIYILLAVFLGAIPAERLIPEKNTGKRQNQVWVLLAASFGIGILFLTWAVYALAFLFHTVFQSQNPLLPANILVMGGTLLLLFVYFRRHKDSMKNILTSRIADRKLMKKECIYYLLLLIFIAYTMAYVFHWSNGYLFSGFTVYGDYAPHTAMMRSFSKGTNYPTQYPHFGGEDIKYHFMFQFLVGNLEYLGLRLDLAYNIVSSFSLAGFLVVLSQIVYKLTGKFKTEILCAVFFFFRSGTAFFQYIAEHFKAGDLIAELSSNKAFIGYTPNENWGLWNYNVYLNQRHLAFGLLLAATAVYVYMEWVYNSSRAAEKGLRFVTDRWIRKEAWVPRDAGKACILGLILGLCAFWNGAALIGCLLVLMGFAVFSDGKMDFVFTAVIAVVLSVLQTRIFIQGSGVTASFYWGFICEDKSISGVVRFIFQISGITVLGCIVLAFFLKRYERILMFAFLFPLFFAFIGSLTPDITVNHKYIMMSCAFLTVFWAKAVVRIVNGTWGRRLLVGILVICLTATGVYDFIIVLRGNETGRRVAVNMNSTLTEWLCENLTSEDLILTPEYSMNEVTMSGVMMYLGWPYYAWSAGYDTYYRAAIAKQIYTTTEEAELRQLVSEEQIDYILFEEDMTFEEEVAIEDTIKDTYELVYTSDDERIRIYETR